MTGGGTDGNDGRESFLVPEVAYAVSAGAGGSKFGSGRHNQDTFIPAVAGALQSNGKAAGSATQQDAEQGMLVAHSLRGEGFDASEDGTGRGVPLVFDPTQITSPGNFSAPGPDDPCHPLAAGARPPAIVQVIPLDMRQASRGATMTNNRAPGSSGGAPGTGIGKPGDPAPVLTSSHTPAIAFPAQSGGTGTVRRLTPTECERLQGFPDGHTLISWRGKPAADCPDGPRYKALGNSMAVNVMSWIGQRIAAVEQLIKAP